jgi:hypothetical protein
LARFGLQPSSVVKPAERVSRARLDALLRERGPDGTVARLLDREADAAMGSIVALSPLTSTLALDYLDRLARPIPSLAPAVGVQIVGRAYVAHMVVERYPARFGAAYVPVLGTLPPPRRGRAPQDLLSRVVKASRRDFESLCALTPGGWAGFVDCLTKRAHDAAGGDEGFVPRDAVDGVARFAWLLRQVDLHYHQEPERRV